MYGIVLSALFSIVTYLLRSFLIKFLFFFALFFITTEFISYLVPHLPGVSSLISAFSAQNPGVWYFLDLFKVGYGLPVCLSSFVLRFMIRRIPVVG